MDDSKIIQLCPVNGLWARYAQPNGTIDNAPVASLALTDDGTIEAVVVSGKTFEFEDGTTTNFVGYDLNPKIKGIE